MSMWGPHERSEYLRSIGAETQRIRESRDLSYRNGMRYQGDVGPLGQIAALYSKPIYETVIDTGATMRSGTMVHFQRQINAYCACGRESEVPPARPGEPHVCAACFRAEQTASRNEQGELNLVRRTVAADLEDFAFLYADPFARHGHH